MKKILIVDDEKLMLKLAEHVLSKSYETICASSGTEAVELFEKEQPDMILSDLKMPGMSGYELQKIINEKSDYGLPFIFMTADESDESESKGFEQGAADYVRKPVKWDLLLKRLERISESIDETNRLKVAADTDGMTGLLNKSASEKALKGACRSSHGMLLMIDLDNFKLVNDIYGHDMGDKVLIRFAAILRSILREGDIAGRIGGDEFIAFIKNLSDEDVVRAKANILNTKILASAKEFMGETVDIPLGVSVGAVSVPTYGREYDKLFGYADGALYSIKQSGKHGYAIYQSNEWDSDTPEKETDLDDFAMIFGERGPKQGAYLVDRDQFQTVYRFLTRFNINYSYEIWFSVFEVSESDTEDLASATNRFANTARTCLRCSDIVLNYCPGKVMIILIKVDEEDLVIPIQRILDKWNAQDNPTEISYNSRQI